VHFFAEMTKANVAPDPLKEITVCNLDDKNETPLCILADPTKPSNKGPDAVNLMEVRGTIKTNKNGKMAIEVPSERTKKITLVKVTLAPDTKLSALFHDLSMVKEGDEVDVPYATEDGSGIVIPHKMKVTLANPLTAGDKKLPSAGKTTAKSK
jgi:hypothetical protein